MTRRALVQGHREGLGPFAKRMDRRQKRQERATRAGDVQVTRVSVIGGAAPGGWSPPDPPPDYTVQNASTDRAFDANATSLDELADVLGTLIADLTAMGLLQ